MTVRGIRGATTADADSEAAIVEATQELLRAMVEANGVSPEDIAGVWFTTTRDLSAEFPAIAARTLGWADVPLMCGHEMEVPNSNPRSIERCIRVLMLVNTRLPAAKVRFVYLRAARQIQQERDALPGRPAPYGGWT